MRNTMKEQITKKELAKEFWPLTTMKSGYVGEGNEREILTHGGHQLDEESNELQTMQEDEGMLLPTSLQDDSKPEKKKKKPQVNVADDEVLYPAGLQMEE